MDQFIIGQLIFVYNRYCICDDCSLWTWFVHQTPGQFADHPEKRTPIAFEILASEQEYMRTLKAISDVYVKPLKSALSSNR